MSSLEDVHSFNSEVFSIGFTVLSAGMLEDFLRLYDTKSFRFNATEAEGLLEEWRTNTVYSEVLTALVSNLCQFRPQQRLEQGELWEWISQFEKEIKDKKDFFIETVPPKLEKEIEDSRKRYPVEEQLSPNPPEYVK